MQTHSKAERLEHANAVIAAMARHGRRFFYCERYDRTSHFVIDDRGQLRFVDNYSGKAVLLVKGGKWRGFSNGGTCRAMVENLGNYVRTGKKCGNHWGPWPEWVCDGDLWGYGHEASQAVRNDIAGNPALKATRTTHHPSSLLAAGSPQASREEPQQSGREEPQS